MATRIPIQWNLDEFAADLKTNYPTIIKVKRLWLNGRISISKVRINFSSSKEINKIKKAKRLLMDDNNADFAIQTYSLPPRIILRCFNCEKYNDPIAAKCRLRNNPICFRCCQQHPYNPTCKNRICCAICHQDYMVGSADCPVKIEERRNITKQLTTLNYSKQEQTTYSSVAKNSNMLSRNPTTHLSSINSNEKEKTNAHITPTIVNKLDLIMSN